MYWFYLHFLICGSSRYFLIKSAQAVWCLALQELSMSKIKLIEQMQEIMAQYAEEQLQVDLKHYPLEILLNEIIQRFPLKKHSDDINALLKQLMDLTTSYLNIPDVTINTVPEHVDAKWVMQTLGITSSTFYRSVNKILLFPAITIGRRPYFLKSDVIFLFNRSRGKGPYIFGKFARIARQHQ